MKIRMFFAIASSLLLALTSFGAVPVAAATDSMSTFLKLGPLAQPANAKAAPGYGLFTCQVGLSVGQCYDPYQMRAAYGIASLISAGFDGTGKTIVIVDAFQNPNLASQIAFYDSFYGLPPINLSISAPDGITPFVVGDPNMTGWAEEISLDVAWAHAIAPGAHIVLELGKDNSDEALVRALNDAVNNNRGDVVSMSFGESDQCLGPDLMSAWHQAFANATKKGMTLFASSGDQGAAQPSCDGTTWIKSTSAPASDPLVTAVGGTELRAADYCLAALGCDPSTHPAPGTYLSEITWNEGAPYGDFANIFGLGTAATGGGFSTVWGQPSYQQGTIPGGKMRAEADVSYNAAILHGVLTYLNIPGLPAGFYRFGGTSAGAPQWAALTVIADQMAGHDYGFINAALYKIRQNAAPYASSFHDITSGTNSALEFDANNQPVDTKGYNAGPGYDIPTGIGTPMSAGLLAQLAAFWSAGQGNAAMMQSAHALGKVGALTHVTPH